MNFNPKDDIAAFAEARLADLSARNLRRVLYKTRRCSNGVAERGGGRLVSFSDNDYLGLSQDPRVKAAVADAAIAYGAGAGASRLVTGDCPLYETLETKLAAMKGSEAAIVFGSGYLANISTIPVLVGKGDLVVLDELSHACMHAGARLSGARVETFRHNDADDAADKLRRTDARRKLVLTETVFSMDGDRAPLNALGEVCADAGAWMMTDDAHGFGVIRSDNPAPVQMGTLSKAVGAYGGYVCGPRALIELLVNRGRGLVYTTGLPPAVLGAAIAALDIIEKEPERARDCLDHAARFSAMIGAPAPHSAVVPAVMGEARAALDASRRLYESGLLVTAIRPPTVPEGTARLRVSFRADHRKEDVERLGSAMRAILTAPLQESCA